MRKYLILSLIFVNTAIASEEPQHYRTLRRGWVAHPHVLWAGFNSEAHMKSFQRQQAAIYDAGIERYGLPADKLMLQIFYDSMRSLPSGLPKYR